ncbi:hypothetical protein HKD37_03G007156 [Glycine soja]
MALIRKPLGKTFTLQRMNFKGDGFSNITRVLTEDRSKTNSMNLSKESKLIKHIDYPWKQDIIGDRATNVITNWQMKDGELIQSELPPTTQYQLPNVKDSNNKPVMAVPFKTKDVNKEVTSKDIKSLMEQANYTNKYLQVSGETIKTKVVPKQKIVEEASPSIPIEKPLFKPFKVSHSRNSPNFGKYILNDSDQNSDNATEIGSVAEKNINPINSKHWKTPSKLYYQRPTVPDLLLEERGENNFKSFSANNIYEWNIDAQTEYNIMNTLQHMTMTWRLRSFSDVDNSPASLLAFSGNNNVHALYDFLLNYRFLLTSLSSVDVPVLCSPVPFQNSALSSLDVCPWLNIDFVYLYVVVAGFFGQLKGWWDNYITNEEKSKIYNAVKTDLNGKVITNDEDKEIPMLTLADFRWYRDTFLTRVYTREDSQQPFWKEKFLAGLPRSLGDKVRDKIRSQSANGDIPYESLSYGQLISYAQKVALKICQDDKIQRQLAKEKAQTKKDLGSFCEQFGLPACPKQKKKQSSSKPVNKKRFPRRRYSHKPSTNDDGQINTLTREQDLLFEAINSIPDPKEKKAGCPGHCIRHRESCSFNSSFDISSCLVRAVMQVGSATFIIRSFPGCQDISRDISFLLLLPLSPCLLQHLLSATSLFQDVETSHVTSAFCSPCLHALTAASSISYYFNAFSNSSIFRQDVLDIVSDIVNPAASILHLTFHLACALSPTQTRSSTQKTKIEGSLTQIATIKPESSTQDSPKPVTAKQTVADYAWSIQTLQSLEDIGLTKIPKLAKKTWGEMASESDDDSETDLQKQIQKTKQTKTVCNPKEKRMLAQQDPTPKPTNNYIPKNKFFNVLQMEPEYWDKNPFKATAKVFPQGFHYRPIALNKTRKFYEFILVDTNSVSIKHFKDSKDPSLNTHSTIQILKVMQPRHYGTNLNQPKKFFAPFDPAGYTYWDYIDAWTNVFWHQNNKYKHLWLIYFKNNTVYNFPNWFLQWWTYFGPIPQIFPEEVQQGFQQFNRLFNNQESRIPVDLMYFSSFALSWIFSWQYRYGKTENNKQYPPLQRHAFVKWWTQFDTSKDAPDQPVQNPKKVLPKTLRKFSTYFNKKIDEESLKKGAESSEDIDDQDDDPFYQNKDDCFGISLEDD